MAPRTSAGLSKKSGGKCTSGMTDGKGGPPSKLNSFVSSNLEKSCFIVIGNKKSRKEVEEQLQQYPIYLCGDKMKQEEKAK